jgi:hypothetical protein
MEKFKKEEVAEFIEWLSASLIDAKVSDKLNDLLEDESLDEISVSFKVNNVDIPLLEVIDALNYNRDEYVEYKAKKLLSEHIEEFEEKLSSMSKVFVEELLSDLKE